MKRLSFPYGIRFQEDGRIEIFPAIELSILGRRETGIRAIFHIDSGATTSILPESDAEVLGINIKDGKEMIVRGISGEISRGYRHLIDIQFDQLNPVRDSESKEETENKDISNGVKIKIPVIFIKDIFVPRILGREGVFPQFGILFDELKQKTAFLNNETERKIIDSLF